MTLLPRDVWALSPWETADLVQGFNDAQGGGDVSPPSVEQYDELVARYG